MLKCPHCEKETTYLMRETKDKNGNTKLKRKDIVYPIKNADGSLNFKNMFRIDIVSLLLIIGLLMLLFGFHQINKQCFDIVSNPCEKAAEIGCHNCAKPITFENDFQKEIEKIKEN